MTKLWGGRFKNKTHPLVERFTSSIGYDYKLAEYDVLGSIAHARMLGKCKIIPITDSAKIIKGLKGILVQIERGKFSFDESAEDIHSNIADVLERKIGKSAQKLHTARSRNDQVVTDLRMYVKVEIKNLSLKIKKLQVSLASLAGKNVEVVIPGFTHLQHAQVVSVAHHLLAYLEMLQRDKARLSDAYKRCDVLPLGSGALSGTTLPIDRKYVAKLLGFAQISVNSMDAVSDRDFVLEILADLSILSMHLSRMAEDFILWMSPEFGLLDLDDAFCTGSSLMPQKKNPDVLELVRGVTGTVYGNLVALLTTMKGLPLTYNRDMQLDKAPLFNSLENITSSLDLLSEAIKGAQVNQAQALILSSDEALYATDLAEYLVRKGVAFAEAHKIIGKLVSYAQDEQKFLSEIPILKWKKFSGHFSKDVYRLLNARISASAKKSLGGTNFREVRKQLNNWKKRLSYNA